MLFLPSILVSPRSTFDFHHAHHQKAPSIGPPQAGSLPWEKQQRTLGLVQLRRKRKKKRKTFRLNHCRPTLHRRTVDPHLTSHRSMFLFKTFKSHLSPLGLKSSLFLMVWDSLTRQIPTCSQSCIGHKSSAFI